MSYMDKIIEENTKPAEPQATPDPKPSETPAPETPAEPDATPSASPTPEPPKETPKAPELKPDLSTLTNEQKAEHAFKRQLGKQRAKYEEIINGMNSKFDSLEKLIKESATPKKEEPQKTRADFPLDKGGDDAYIAYLTEQGVKKALAEQKAEQEKADAQKAENERKIAENDAQLNATKEMFGNNCKAYFTEPEKYEAFRVKMNKAVDNGFADILDMAPAIRDYLFTQPEGPMLLEAMLNDKDTMAKVLNLHGNPILATVTLHQMGQELKAKKEQPAPTAPEQPAQQKGMPHLGKPGARGDGPRNVMGSDKDIIKFLRSVH